MVDIVKEIVEFVNYLVGGTPFLQGNEVSVQARA
jgi:hypothetical protein